LLFRPNIPAYANLPVALTLTENIFPEGPSQSNEISPSASGATSGAGRERGSKIEKAIAASAVLFSIVGASWSVRLVSADSATICSISEMSGLDVGAE